jgi:endo-1,4-beta-xylanase
VRGLISLLILGVFTVSVFADISKQDAKFAKLPRPVSETGPGVLEGMARALGKTNPLGFAEWKDIADGPEPSVKTVLRLATRKPTEKQWGVQTTAKVNIPIKKGDLLLAVFHARGEFMAKEDARCVFVFEEGKAPWAKSAEHNVEVEKDWQKFYVAFPAKDNYAPGEAQMSFHAGFGPQVIQIAGLRVMNFADTVKWGELPITPLSYRGREAGAEWRREAEARIEQYRKAPLTVYVYNAKGRKVVGAEVRIRQVRHAYGFGSAVDAAHLLADTEDGEKYRSIVESSFNKVTFENDMKWEAWEKRKTSELDPFRWTLNGEPLLRGNLPLFPEWPYWEGPLKPPVETALDWLTHRDIAVRGHVLLWPGWKNLPKELEALSHEPPKLRKRILDHIREQATALKGRIVDWDVVNEPYSNYDMQKILGEEILVDAFKAARDADPKARLFVNDYGILSHGGADTEHHDSLYKTIQMLKAAGAPIGGIGFQGHFDKQLTPPVKVWEVLDRFSAFGLPIQITEHDIDVLDEEAWADYTRDFMIACFAHPATNAFITWGFWEGRHWIPNAALWTKDWQAKSAARIWYDLVFKKWWSNVRAWTDYKGRMKSKLFLGDYIIEVKYGGMKAEKAYTLKRGVNYVEIMIRPPAKDQPAVPAKK